MAFPAADTAAVPDSVGSRAHSDMDGPLNIFLKLAIGERLKEKHQEEFQALKTPYAKAVLKTVPAHLRKIKEYDLQFVFHTDGLFLLHCIVALLENGKLKLPTEGQRKALTTLIVKE